MPRTNRQKSIRQEAAAAKMIGGRRRRGSGSAPGLPGDAYGERFLVECKFTNQQSFSVKLSDLTKIEVSALTAGKIPLFRFGFADGDDITENDEWVAFPAYFFPQLIK